MERSSPSSDEANGAGELAKRIARNLLLWTGVCTIAAAPSFFTAREFGDFEPAGMITGVVLFIFAYTCVACTPFVQRLKQNPSIRLTLRIGYGTRLVPPLLLLIVVVPDVYLGTEFASVFPVVGIVFMIDFLPGVLSMMLGGQLARLFGAGEFGGTLITTLVQGTVLNVMLAVYLLIIYALIRTLGGKRYSGVDQCPACGYDLRGSRGSACCPECGEHNPWAVAQLELAAVQPGGDQAEPDATGLSASGGARAEP